MNLSSILRHLTSSIGLPTVITPKSLTPSICTFCRSLVGQDAKPFYLPIAPTDFSQIGKCHINVAKHTAEHGGEQVFCWSIWHYKPYWLEADFHSLWRDQAGHLHDITPDPDGERQRLLVLDPTRRFEGYCIPKKYFLLSKDKRVRQAMLLYERANNAQSKYPADERVNVADSKQIAADRQQASRLLTDVFLGSK